MKQTALLNLLGQSPWQDNITRRMLEDGSLQRTIDSLGITGLTSNPTIFEKAIGSGSDYDAQVRECAARGLNDDATFFELALADLCRACDLFLPIHRRTGGVDGWVSLEVSPLLANDTRSTVEAAVALHARANRPNLFIKVPGTPEGLPAITELIARGVPVNVTLLFDVAQYEATVLAYVKGLEQRAAKGLAPDTCSVASVFISRWDKATAGLPEGLRNRVGIAMGRACYDRFLDIFSGERFEALRAKGARPQRLLYASTGTKDPALPKSFYVEALCSPGTVNTMPEDALHGLANAGTLKACFLPGDPATSEVLKGAMAHGVDLAKLAGQLQVEGRDAFIASWHALLKSIASKRG
ncbi:MAG: transaldolase [Planctomycetota bacterium]|jgi:transaldolase